MQTPRRIATTDLMLGAVAVALVLLPLPALMTVDADDLARLGLLTGLFLPPAVLMGIARQGPARPEMRTEAVRARRCNAARRLKPQIPNDSATHPTATSSAPRTH